MWESCTESIPETRCVLWSQGKCPRVSVHNYLPNKLCSVEGSELHYEGREESLKVTKKTF